MFTHIFISRKEHEKTNRMIVDLTHIISLLSKKITSMEDVYVEGKLAELRLDTNNLKVDSALLCGAQESINGFITQCYVTTVKQMMNEKSIGSDVDARRWTVIETMLLMRDWFNSYCKEQLQNNAIGSKKDS